MDRTRCLAVCAAAAVTIGIAACSGKAIPFPETIAFGGRQLTKATDWTREGMSAIVYVPPGEKVPEASLQVGVIISDTHTTAEALHTWVLEQSLRGDGPPMFSGGEPGAVCRVNARQVSGGPRMYMALQVCKTGVARAACVEADETIDSGTFNDCVHGRCQPLCDLRWIERREALDLLAADFLTKR